MISRHWTGIARQGQAEDYLNHLRRETFPGLATIPGFVRASVLRREVEGGTEFRVVTLWESWEAVQAFAGAAPEEAVVPGVVQAMMVRYDRQVVHYAVADTYLPG